MLSERADFRSAGQVPQLDGPVLASAGELLAVGAKRQAVNPIDMADEGLELSSTGNVHNLIVLSLLPVASCVAVTAKRDTGNPISMAREGL